MSSESFGQVSITESDLTNICVGAGYYGLNDIEITETSDNDFQTSAGSVYIRLDAPTNFEFKPGIANPFVLFGTDITIISFDLTSNYLEFELDINSETGSDMLVIQNLQIRAVSSASTNAKISRVATSSGTDATIVGAPLGTEFGTLGSITPPSISSEPVETDVCENDDTALSVTADGDFLTYQWQRNAGSGFENIDGSLPDGANYSNFNTPVLQIGNATTSVDGYTYRVLITGVCLPQASSVTVALNVDPKPTIPTISFLSGSNSVCDGVNPEITLESSAAPNSGSYEWFKDGVSTGITSQTIDINDPAGSGDYTVQVADGITFCLSEVSLTETIAINPLPNAGLTVTPSASEVCDGNTLTFTIAGSQNGVDYELFNASNTSFSAAVGGNGGSITITSTAFSADETISVRATNSSTGCSVELTDTESITVNPLPAVTLNSDDLDNIICNGSSVIFTAAGATNYQFFVNGLAVQGPSTATTFTTASLTNGDVVTVRGTDASTCAFTPAGITVTVENAPAAPTIISSSGSTVCDDTNPEVTLTSQAAPNGGDYQWYKNGAEIIGETSQTINISDPAGSGDYSVAVSDGNNTAFCLSAQSAAETVTINALPNAGLTVTPSASEVCDGNTLTFTIAGSQNGVDYELFNASNTSFSAAVGGNGGSITITSTAFSADETISVRATNSSTGCSVDLTDTESITVNPLPAVTLNSDDLDNIICNGSSVIFTAAGATNYQFFVNGLAVQGPSTATTFTTASLTNGDVVTVRGTDASTCAFTPAGITVTVENAPAAPTIISSSGSTVCDDTNPEVTLTSQAAPNGGDYQWYKNGAEIIGETSQTINISDPAGSGDYSVAVSDGNNTAFCLSAQSAAETVTINALPNAGLTVTPSASEVCDGNTLTFTIAGSQNGVDYELFNASNTSFSAAVGGNGGSITITSTAFSADETISVRATNSSTGCSVELTDTESITVNPLPAVTLNSDDLDNIICNGSSVIFTAAGATNYQFFVNGLAVQGPSTATTFTTASLTNGDVVTVRGTDASTCAFTPAGITVTVENAPAAPTIISSSGSTVCDDTNPEVTLTSQAAPNGGDYQWYKNGAEIIGETSQTINISDPAGSGDYSVAVSDGNNTAFCLSAQSAAETVTINALPNAGLTVTPSASEVCDGNTLTFTIAGSQNGVDYELFNASNTSFSAAVGGNGGSITITSTAFSADETISVRATNSSTGCSVELTDTESITVNPLPAVTLNSDDLDNIICNGSSVIFTAAGATNYQFFVNGLAVQGPSTATTFTTASLTNGDVVTVRGTDASTCAFTPAGITVTVENAPAAPTIISSSGSTVCDDTNPEVTLTSQAAPNGGDYQWYKNGAEIIGETSQTINISDPAGSGDYSVAVSDGNNTAFCLSAQSAAETVTINALPNAGLTVTPSASEVCDGNTLTFTIAGSQNGVDYELFNASNTSFSAAVGGNGGSITITSTAFSADETISVRATNSSTGCSVELTDTESITVNPLPAVTLNSDDLDNIICNGSSVIFTAAGATNYQFFVNGLAVQGPSTATTFTTASLTNGDVVTVRGTDASTCAFTPAGITVTVENAPAAPTIISSSGSTVCDDTNPEVTLTSQAAPNGGDYQWYKNGAEIIGETSQTINISDPAGSGDYSVAVSDGNNTAFCLSAQSAAETVTINALPNAGLTVTPSASEVCDGNTLTFTIAGSQNGVDYELFNASNTSFSAAVGGNGGSITITSTAFSADETISVRATNSSTGCSVELTDTESITVNPLPAVTLNSDDLDNIICNGSSVIFTAAGATNYQFFVNGLAVQGPSTATTFTTASLTNGDVVTVRGTDASTCAFTPAGITVTVENAPAAPTIISSSGSTVCDDTNPEVTLTSQAAPNGGDYQWYKNGAEIIGETSQTINISDPAGSGDYSVAVSDGNNTAFCLSAQSAAETVTINALPNAGLTVTPSASEVCDGNTLTFTIAGSQNGVDYELFNASNTSFSAAVGGNGGSITITSTAFSADETISVRATNSSTGCSVELTDTESITVNPLPAVTLNSDDLDNIICNGSSVIFTAAGATNYQFFVNGLAVQGPSTATTFTTASLTNGDVVTVRGTDASTCAFTPAGITVTVENAPAAPTIISSSGSTVCDDTNPEVTLTSQAAPNGGDYQWYKNGAEIIGETSQTINISDPAGSGDYSVAVSDGNNTAFCLSAQSAAETVTINALPNAGLTVTPSASEVCDGNTLTFTIAGSQNGVNYQLFNEAPAAFSSIVGGNGGTITIISDVFTGLGASENITVRATNATTTCFVDLTDTETVTINAQPIVNAGSGGDECDLDFSLNATPSVGTGTWTKVNGTGNASFAPNANDPNAVVTVDDYDTYQFRWTEVNGTCSDFADITVNFYEQPAAIAGSGGDECDLNFIFSPVPSVGTGTWTQEAGPGTTSFNFPNSPNPTATVTAYGTYTYRWTEVNGSCSDFDEITVNFYEQPAAVAGTGGDECDLDFALNATPSIGTGTWTKVNGTGNASFTPNANDPNATVTVDAYDTYDFRWTEDNNGCTDSDEITVNFYEQPAAVAGTGGDECDLDFSLNATPSVGTGTWTKVSGSGNASFTPNANDPNATVTVDAYDTYDFRWTEENNGCTDSDEITVNFYEQPAAVAGTGGDECDLDFALNATPSVGTGTWTKVSGSGNASFTPNANDPNATVTVDAYDTYDFRWTEDNNGCTDSDEITVNFYEQPAAVAGTGGDECDLDFALNATPSIGTGTWTKVNGTGNASFTPNANDPNATVTVDAYDTYDFRWTEDNNGCTDSDEITVNFYEQPAAVAGTGGDECDLDFALNATPSVGTGTWTKVSGSGNASFTPNANDPNATVTVDAYDTYDFRWTEDNNGCTDSDEITVNFYEQPAAVAGTGGDECDLDFALNATPSVGTGTWTKVSGSGNASFTPNANDPNATVTVDAYDTYDFRWTEDNNGCTDSDEITVNFYEQPAAVAGTGGDECDLDFSLNATPSVGTGTWTKVSGSGNASFTPNANDPNATVTVDAYDTYDFRWTEDNNGCTDSDEITVNFYEQPAAVAGTGGDECDLDFSLNATPSIGTGTWTKVSGSGNASFTPNANDPNATVTVDAYDTYDFRWTEDNNGCTDSDEITVNFYEQPAAVAGTGGDECDLDFSLNATPSVGTGTWTKVSGSGNASFTPNANDPNATVTVDAYDTYDFRWTEDNNGCTDSDEITVNFYEQPAAVAGTGGDECDLDFSLNATPSVGTGTWTKVSGSGNASFTPNANDPNATVTVDAYDTYDFRWTEDNNGCTDSDEITVNFYEQPTAVAGTGGDECDLDFDLSATPSVGTGTWTKVSGFGNASFTPNANDPNATVTVDAYDTYDFRWTEDNNGCTDSDEITVNFYEQPTAVAGTGGDECDLDFDLSATPSVGTGTWTKVSGFGNASFTPNANDPNATVTVDAYDTYDFRWTEDNNGCTDSDEITVNFYEQPAAVAGTGGDECDLDFSLNATPSVGTGTWTKVSGSGNASFTPNANDPNATVTVDAYDTYDFRWTEDNNGCTDSDEITVNFYEQPAAVAGTGGDECDLDFALNATPSVGTGTWTKVSGSGNASFTPNANDPNATVTVDAYDTYDFRWTEVNGTCSDFDDIQITFNPLPIANDLTDSFCEDLQGSGTKNVDLTSYNSSINSQAGTTITWYEDASLSTPVSTPSSVDVTDNSDYFAEVSFNATGCKVSAMIQFTIDSQPVASVNTTASNLCAAEPFTLRGAIAGGAVAGEWRIQTGQGFVGTEPGTLSTTTNNSGSWEATFEAEASFVGNVIFEFVAIGTSNCGNDVQVYTLNIRSLPAVMDFADELCGVNTDAPGRIFLNLTNYNSQITTEDLDDVNVSWFNDIDLTDPVTGPTSEEVIDNSTYYARVSFLSTSCFNKAQVDFNVDPRIDLTAGSDEEICDGESFNLANSDVPPVADNTTSLQWTTSNGDGTFDVPTDLHPTYTPAGNDLANSPIILILTGNSTGPCPQIIDQMELTIKPTPVLSSIDDQEYCSEEFVSIPFTVSLAGTSLGVTNSNPSIVSGSPIVNGNNIEFTTAINTTGSPLQGTFELTSLINGCEVTETFQVTLNNTPVVNPVTDRLDECANATISGQTFSHSSGTGTFNWEVTNPDLIGDGSATTGTGDFPGFTASNNVSGSTIDGYVRYYSVNSTTSCVSEADSFKIAVKPAPLVLNEDVVFYAGDQANVEFLSNTAGNTDFYWSNDQTSIGINNVQGNTENIVGNTITPNGFIATNPFTSDDNIATITVYGINNDCRGPDRQFRIIVKPNPIIDISYQNVCDIDNAVKLDFETSFNDLESDSIVAYNWSLPDNPEIEVQNDTALFNSSGRKNVRLQVQTALNRTFTSNYTIEVWNVEDINFTTTNVSTSTIEDSTGTKFSPSVTLEPAISTDIVELTYEWDFGDPASGVNNVSSEENPTHNYQNPGMYDVTLFVTAEGISEGANDSCVITKINSINIVESVNSFPYIEDFEDGPAGWGSSAGSGIGSSWTYIENNTVNYFSNSKNSSKVWGTVLNDRQAGFIRDENSYLQTPNFDFSQLDKPMIAFDMWLDVEDQNRAGAVIEYSTDDVNWRTLGEIGDPLNWYNTNTLNAIGGEISNEDQIAWSYYQNEDWQWKRVAYPLDELKSLESTIFLRVNFKGNDNENSSGMAIDNFYVGERQKLVLLENFTNLNSSNYITNRNYLQNLRASDISNDILQLNFHISIPSPDSINLRNSVEMDARASLYSIEESPKIIIDGKLLDEEIDLAGGALPDEVENVITRRSLIEGSDLVDIEIDSIANESTIRFKATMEPNMDTTTLIAYFFIIEKSISLESNMTNIVRKILPDINGVSLNNLSETTSADYEWEVSSIYTNDELAVVSIVQERNTNRIIEIKMADIDQTKTPENILGIEEGFNSIGMSVYPNPSRGNVNLKFNKQLNSDLKILVFDSNGKVLKTSTILKGTEETEIDLNYLASGVYHIITKSSEGKLNRQKIVILD